MMKLVVIFGLLASFPNAFARSSSCFAIRKYPLDQLNRVRANHHVGNTVTFAGFGGETNVVSVTIDENGVMETSILPSHLKQYFPEFAREGNALYIPLVSVAKKDWVAIEASPNTPNRPVTPPFFGFIHMRDRRTVMIPQYKLPALMDFKEDASGNLLAIEVMRPGRYTRVTISRIDLDSGGTITKVHSFKMETHLQFETRLQSGNFLFTSRNAQGLREDAYVLNTRDWTFQKVFTSVVPRAGSEIFSVNPLSATDESFLVTTDYRPYKFYIYNGSFTRPDLATAVHIATNDPSQILASGDDGYIVYVIQDQLVVLKPSAAGSYTKVASTPVSDLIPDNSPVYGASVNRIGRDRFLLHLNDGLFGVVEFDRGCL